MENILRDVLYIILSGCGVAIAKYIVNLINKKVDEAQINTEIKEHEKLNGYVDDAQEAIKRAVISTTQTYVESLKNSGSFSKEAQEEAKNKAMEVAKQLITEESRNAIIVLYGDFDIFLDSTLEMIVNKNK